MTRKLNSVDRSFEAGKADFKKAMDQAGLDPNAQVLTSKDEAAVRSMDYLKVKNVPTGFTKVQLPFAQEQPTNFYSTVGQPNAVVERHAHELGSGFRFLVKGSLVIDGKTLVAGDWMFIPKGIPYSYVVGSEGVEMMAGYECCCRGTDGPVGPAGPT